MRYIEERLRELEAYRPELTRRPDFREFWENTLAESQARELRPKAEQVDYPCGHARVYDISYDCLLYTSRPRRLRCCPF